MTTNNRSYRVGDQIQKDLVQLIRSAIKDPRLSRFITIEEVRVSKDLSIAKVYFTILDGDVAQGDENAQILQNAAGFLRSELGKRIRMRSIPSLRFIHDTTAIEARRMSGLIDAALKADKANAGEH